MDEALKSKVTLARLEPLTRKLEVKVGPGPGPGSWFAGPREVLSNYHDDSAPACPALTRAGFS